MDWIDLHVHSTASDGTRNPEQLPEEVLKAVKQQGEEGRFTQFILALTDHDTTAGIQRLKAAAEKLDYFRIVSGVEISCDYQGKTIHMLGLGIDEMNYELNERLAYYRDFRDHRNEKIVERFKQMGISLSLESIPIKEGEALGRPHIARELMKLGLVSSIQEAFDQYLGEGKPCFVERERASLQEAIRLIKGAGGSPVLAHPMQYRGFKREELELMISELTAMGLEGIETYYSEYSEEETVYVESLSEKFGLVKTGGSDYHGENKPGCELGYGFGNLGKTMDKIEWK